ncbi:hypothetical protein [Sphingomicrobium flavum]|uniref:hypothetical protein n=1 Tax=Sphingomicrobium flavum TaxID=1229164 RepID=UPI0021ADBFF8|nr:hypothetical protein [Sphingomicrobium flavum]
MNEFEAMLTGGHPNSLGRTEEVVAMVLDDPARMSALMDCYGSDDAVVRLRVSSALKRIEPERRDLVLAQLDRLFGEAAALDQPSADWTIAQLLLRMEADLAPHHKKQGLAILQRNLAEKNDWIVLNMTMETLTRWAQGDAQLAAWLRPHLQRLAGDPRKSVAARARKFQKQLG